jgi:TM2 domain-containing membrane protein YozV
MSYRESGTTVSRGSGKTGVSPKSWVATALLALPCLLGPFGAHRFYAGKIKTAWAMLGLALSGFICIGLGVLAKQLHFELPQGISVLYFAAFLANFLFLTLVVWATVDLVLVLTDNFMDGQGRPIKRL